MAVRARLVAPQLTRDSWPWHEARTTSLPVSLLCRGDRRMEAENYLATGFGIRLALEAQKAGWMPMKDLARVWQPSRLKGIQVAPRYGKPFLGATQVFDLRPVARKWLSLERTADNAERFVGGGTILVTCSGNVGRATLAHKPIEGHLISHDLLRVEPLEESWRGWLYSYLRAPQARAMMVAAQYGHIIKHLEIAHMDTLPVPVVDEETKRRFGVQAARLIQDRNRAYSLLLEAERLFEISVGSFQSRDLGEGGFSLSVASLSSERRRLDAWTHNPSVIALREHLQSGDNRIERLESSGFKVWLPNRFRRVAARDGVGFLDSSDLFEVNPDTGRTVADLDFGDPYRGRVKAGWLLMARSGQIYGLNGSVVLATAAHEDKVVSDDVIRIAPSGAPNARSGYVFIALSHPQLGRPLVKALAYGSSIPHIDTQDVCDLPLVRLGRVQEDRIADLAEEASSLYAGADVLENRLAMEADLVIAHLLAGDTSSP